MFKGKLALVSALVLMSCMVFAGCGENNSASDAKTDSSITASTTTTTTTATTTTSSSAKQDKTKSKTKQTKKKTSSKAASTTTEVYTTEYKAVQTTENQTPAEVRVQDQNGGCVGNDAALY